MRNLAILLACLMVATAAAPALAWGPTDPTDRKADPDGDKLGNLDEFRAGTNPLNPDTDLGGCWDGWEVLYGFDPTNPKDELFDSDNDGWSNLREFMEGTNPLSPNTDSDCFPLDSTDPRPLVPDDPWGWGGPGVPVYRGRGSGTGDDGRGQGIGQGQGQGTGQRILPPEGSVDSDHDGIPDEDEDSNGNGDVDPGETDPKDPDTDHDGIIDSVEPIYGTDPTNPDCDGDGLRDGREILARTDPRNPDCDGDGLLDGQEFQKDQWDWCYTGTNPLKADTDGDGVRDYQDDEDGDGLPNGEEWRYDPSTKLPTGWTDPRGADTDGDGVPDGSEVYGNPKNKAQTSDPLKRDTDGDRLTDDIDPRTWIRDYLPFSRVGGRGDGDAPAFPELATKGVPFNVEGHIDYNVTAYTGPGTGMWERIKVPMVVQVWLRQGGELIPISDAVVTGEFGSFKVTCTLGDDVRAGEATLVITTTIYQGVAYLPVMWDEIAGNILL